LDFGAGEKRREVGVGLFPTFSGGEVSNVVAGRLEASSVQQVVSTIVVTGDSHHIADSIQEVIHASFFSSCFLEARYAKA
jgi:hypothetical protein